MKRSEINTAIVWAKALLEKNNIHLPVTAYWSMDQWKQNAGNIDTIRKVMMGWDITDFGTNDFKNIGAVLYTVRNGKMDDPTVGVPYCEKYIVMKDGQIRETGTFQDLMNAKEFFYSLYTLAS